MVASVSSTKRKEKKVASSNLLKRWLKSQMGLRNFRISEKNPAVNFINILRTNFSYERRFGSFFHVQVTYM